MLAQERPVIMEPQAELDSPSFEPAPPACFQKGRMGMRKRGGLGLPPGLTHQRGQARAANPFPAAPFAWSPFLPDFRVPTSLTGSALVNGRPLQVNQLVLSDDATSSAHTPRPSASSHLTRRRLGRMARARASECAREPGARHRHSLSQPCQPFDLGFLASRTGRDTMPVVGGTSRQPEEAH